MDPHFSNRWKSWGKLNRQQKMLFFNSLVYLKIADVLLYLFRYQDLYNFLKEKVPLKERASADVDTSQAIKMAEVVELAARRRLISATCLRRSLVLWYLLRREGVDSNLRFGVRKVATEIEGHAWVEIDGSVINDDESRIRQFSPMDLEN